MSGMCIAFLRLFSRHLSGLPCLLVQLRFGGIVDLSPIASYQGGSASRRLHCERCQATARYKRPGRVHWKSTLMHLHIVA
ncbi:hypothetical protein F4679DRAFT_540221 [Xylaria curta]|nr:hypothetical protein F4679DRAFT_540221 [Xylaria curta]